MNAEELIDQYLVAKDKIKHDNPKAVANAVKGIPVKKDKLQDVPFRDMDNNVDQDNTWRASSIAPYQ